MNDQLLTIKNSTGNNEIENNDFVTPNEKPDLLNNELTTELIGIHPTTEMDQSKKSLPKPTSEYARLCDDIWKSRVNMGAKPAPKSPYSKAYAGKTFSSKTAEVEMIKNQVMRKVQSKPSITCTCKRESRFCLCTETEIQAKQNALEMEICTPIKNENEMRKNRELEVNGLIYSMQNNIKTIVDKNENHFMIINEIRSIESKLDDFNSPKKQVCKTIHLWIKDKDFEEYFEMHNMDSDEKKCFEEDWSKNWKPAIQDEEIETTPLGIPVKL